MKIFKQRLKEIIKEEFSVLQESVESYDIEREEASNEGEAERQIPFPVVSQADMDAAMGVTEPRLEPGTPEERAVVASSDKVKQHLRGEGVSLDSVSIKRYLEDLGLPPAIAGQYALWSAEKV